MSERTVPAVSQSLAALDSAAASYVLEHHLEESLSAALDLAIEQKSTQPLTVIADYLTRLADAKGDVDDSFSGSLRRLNFMAALDSAVAAYVEEHPLKDHNSTGSSSFVGSLGALDSAAASYVEEHNFEEVLPAAVALAIEQKSTQPLRVIAAFLSKLAVAFSTL